MKRKIRKLICLLMAFFLAVGTLYPSAPVYAAAKETGSGKTANLLAQFTFDDEDSGFAGGGAIAEKVGTIALSDDAVRGKALSLNGGANYLNVKGADGGSLLTGKDSITVSFDSKITSNGANWPFYASPNTNKQEYQQETYVGILENGTSVTSERYHVGPRPISATVSLTNHEWKHVALVITETDSTLYVDGVSNQVNSAFKLSDILGGQSIIQIGKANWGDNGEYFQGLIDNFAIYDEALSRADVMALYLEHANEAGITRYLNECRESFQINDLLFQGAAVGNLDLPDTYENAKISWTSGNPEVITDEGILAYPNENTDVTLTAALSYGDISVTKDFSFTVVPKEAIAELWEAEFSIPYALSSADQLPVAFGDAVISWTGDDAVKADGKLEPDFTGKKEVDLKAEFTLEGTRKEKTFRSILFGSDANYILGYTRTPDANNNLYSAKLAYSLHLAFSEDGDAYQSLNDNSGVLFAKATSAANEVLTAKSLKNPYLFYMKDGTIGVAAVRTESNGEADTQSKSQILLFQTEDLLTFEEKGLIDLKTDKTVDAAICEYDAREGVYRITWRDSEGAYYENAITDFQDLGSAEEPIVGKPFEAEKKKTGITGAVEQNIIPVTNEAGQKVKRKLSKIENTKMEVQETVIAESKEDLEKVGAKAYYSDGSTLEREVDWDTSTVNWDAAGTYDVTGQIKQEHYSFPIIVNRADPNIIRYKGAYYFIATEEGPANKFYVRKGDTPSDIQYEKDALILDGTTYPEMFTGCLWAPEFHEINGDLYIFFAGSLNGGWNQVQSYVMKLKENGDPQKKADWEKPIRVQNKEGNHLYENTSGITLDMTYFEVENQGYVMWAQRQILPVDTGSWLYLATVDKAAPWKLTSDPVVVAKPDYGWDNNNTFVVEGPFALQTEDKVIITFSGAATDQTYAVGMLSADKDTDLLDASSWTKGNYPILTSRSVDGEYGPGHNSYVVDEQGYTLNVYHAKPGYNGSRSAGIRRVHFDIDGMPVLDMTEDRDVKIKTVSTKVQVLNTKSDAEIADAILQNIEIPNQKEIKENITLPKEIVSGGETYALTWESSKEAVISTQETPNKDYAATPAGVVTRQSKDTDVVLKVSVTYKSATRTREIPVTVIGKAKEEEYVAYLYAHFNELIPGTSLQQIYFGVSKDGLQWTALNDNEPVLSSTVGDKGVRDPYIIRSIEGDKFYLIATDLDIHHPKYGGDWGKMGGEGSQDLIIWESSDLVNWSESRNVTVSAGIEAGCTWAPEAVYDEKTGEYLVFWSSTIPGLNHHEIFVSKTRDFYSFTEPELYSDPNIPTIDASIYRENGKYYRLLKESNKNYVYLQVSDELLNYKNPTTVQLGDREFVDLGSAFTNIDNSAAGCLETFTGGYEGPTMFKVNGEEKWCILVDEYGARQRGYIPFFTDDLDQPNSIKLAEDGTYTMTDGAKHGTVIPITQKEYDDLMEKWGVINEKYTEEREEPILEYDFEETKQGNVIRDKADGNDGTAFGNAQYRQDTQTKSNVLYLDGSEGTYAQLPTGLFDGLDQLTVSMDMKPETTDTYHFDFTIGLNTQRYLFLRIRDNQIYDVITSRGSGQEKGITYNRSSNLNKWTNVTMVMDNHIMKLYIDGELADTKKSVRNISELGSDLISYLGKSFYQDPYYKGSYDNVKVYNRALSEAEIKGETPKPDPDQERAAEVIEKIDAIGQVTKDSKEAIEAARTAYEELTESQKKLVTNKAVLDAAWEAYLEILKGDEDQKAAGKVMDLIAAIGAVTEGSGGKIQEAETAYNVLSADQKKLVTNKAVLDAAKRDYQILIKEKAEKEQAEKEKAEKERADKAAAQAVVSKISAIGTVSLGSKAKIEEARKAYTALSADQKKLVTNYSILTGAESAYQQLSGLPKKGQRISDGKYYYKVTKAAGKNGTVSLYRPKKKTMTKAVVPASIKFNGVVYKVTAIDKKAFYKNKKLRTVTIGKNVTSIGSKVFYGCSRIKTISIKSTGLKNVKKTAFQGLNKNLTVKVPGKKLKDYKNRLKNKGFAKTVKFRK